MRLSLPERINWRGWLTKRYGVGIVVVSVSGIVATAVVLLASELAETSRTDSSRPSSSKASWSKQWVSTATGKSLEYILNGVRIIIPKGLVRPIPGLDKPNVQVFAVWPGMSPWPPKLPPSIEASASRIIVYIKEGNYLNPRDSIDRAIQSDRVTPTGSVSSAPGLDCYAHSITKRCVYYGSDDRELYDANGNEFTIRCAPPIRKKPPECSVVYQLARNVAVHYRFYETHIRDWRKIHNAVTGFLATNES